VHCGPAGLIRNRGESPCGETPRCRSHAAERRGRTLP
jgi:hypothetical protein